MKGICENNIDCCSYWQSEEVQEVDEKNSVCQGCGKPLKNVDYEGGGNGKKGRQINWKRIFNIIAAVLVVVGICVGSFYAYKLFTNHINPVSILLDKTTLSLKAYETAQLTATVQPDNATDKSVTWSSSNEEVAKVEKGKVTAVAEGEAVITVSTGNDILASCNVEVIPSVPVESVSLNKTSVEIKPNGTATLVVSVLPDSADNKDVLWKSNNEAVATVSETGIVTAVAEGKAVITASTGNGVSASCEVVVPPPPPPSYCFGKYTGSLKYSNDLKKNIPEGDGTMTYTGRVQIAKHDTQNPAHYAEAGDKFVGSWGNGDIVSGALYDKNGVIKEKIFAPKRFNPYDISKDCQ